jgi:hypothetical protein
MMLHLACRSSGSLLMSCNLVIPYLPMSGREDNFLPPAGVIFPAPSAIEAESGRSAKPQLPTNASASLKHPSIHPSTSDTVYDWPHDQVEVMAWDQGTVGSLPGICSISLGVTSAYGTDEAFGAVFTVAVKADSRTKVLTGRTQPYQSLVSAGPGSFLARPHPQTYSGMIVMSPILYLLGSHGNSTPHGSSERPPKRSCRA